jgi:hypothetical protein
MRYLISDLGANVTQADDEGYTSLFIAAHCGQLAVVRYLSKELSADVNKATKDGATPLFMAAQDGLLAIVRCLVKELSADVNHAKKDGTRPLYIAAQMGHLDVVRCLVEELGADVNLARKDGATALMVAASEKHHKIVAYLMRHGADPQASAPRCGTAADVSKRYGAPTAQTAYLEAKTQCSNPGCAGAGFKKCTGCKHVRYCGQQCQLAHWPAHKVDCKAAAELRASKGK